MKFWPKSLFWRSALLIGCLLFVSQLALSIVFYVYVQRPRINFAQDLTLIYLDNVRVTLAALPPLAREKFLRDLDKNADLRVTRDSPQGHSSAIARQPLVRLFLEELQERLPPGERAVVQEAPAAALWVSLLVEGEPYWIVARLEKLRILNNAALVLPFVLSIFLAALGGVLIHRSLNRPITELQHAASAMGRGERPPLLTTGGPTEVAALSHAFNRMAQDLDSMEADRRLMLAGISHDLRTPVTRLRLALEVHGEQLDDQIRERMLANLHELDSFLSQFLDFARSEREEPIVQADLYDIANECVAAYEAQGQSILLLGRRGVTSVPVRPQALMRALKNLVDNSLKYSKGEIEVEVALQQATKEPVLAVRDRGMVLRSANFERIAFSHNVSLVFLARDGGGLEVQMQFKRPLTA